MISESDIKIKAEMFLDIDHDIFESMNKTVFRRTERASFIKAEINCYMINNGLSENDIKENGTKCEHLGFTVYKYKRDPILIIEWPIFGTSARVRN